MPEFEERMEQLRRRYRERLAAETRQMEELASGSPSGVELEQIRQMAHKLAGISGSMGYPTVSHAALALDRDWTTSRLDIETLHKALKELCGVADVCRQSDF